MLFFLTVTYWSVTGHGHTLVCSPSPYAILRTRKVELWSFFDARGSSSEIGHLMRSPARMLLSINSFHKAHQATAYQKTQVSATLYTATYGALRGFFFCLSMRTVRADARALQLSSGRFRGCPLGWQISSCSASSTDSTHPTRTPSNALACAWR